MAEQIIDGTNGSFRAKVDSNNRLHTRSVSSTELSNAVLEGEAYSLSTGVIILTSDTESAVFYIEYRGDDPLVIKDISVTANPSIGGAGDGFVKIVKNPFNGTIQTNAVAVDINENRNFSSAKSINGNIYKGVEGDTVVGGDNFAITTRDAGFDGVISFDRAPILLKKGNVLAVTFDPATGNTSQTIIVDVNVFVETATVNGGV
jgi:hypothetical protein